MIRIRQSIRIIIGALLLCGFVDSAALAATINLLAPGAYKAALDSIAPAFEKASGHHLVLKYAPSAIIAQWVEGGEQFDVAITAPAALKTFAQAGKVLADPQPVIGVNGVLLAYRSGMQKPDVSTPEALKSALLAAKRISFSDPAAGGSSSNYFISVVKQLGIEDEVKRKSVLTKPAEGAFPVLEGKADIGVAQMSEVAMAKGLESVALNPADPKSNSSYAAGISSRSQQGDAARAFIAFIVSPEGLAIRRATGLAPK
jgi:molybdate transport system substrate-binding protein